MSPPIAIPHSNVTSPSSSSLASSSLSSAPTMPILAGLYVPIHKRTGSSSSRASSLSSARFPAVKTPKAPKQHLRIYTADFLLSLRLNADKSAKKKMRTACPEVVMNRCTRKNLEFAEHQHQKEAATRSRAEQQQQPTAAPAQARVMPQRNRPAGHAPE